MAFQDLVYCIIVTKLKEFLPLNISKKKTSTAKTSSSQFYYNSWLTNANKFPQTVVCFEEISTSLQDIDSSIQQCITNIVTFAIIIVVAAIKAKQKDEILSLHEMIEKFLLLRDSPMTTPLSNPNISTKTSIPNNTLLKVPEK